MLNRAYLVCIICTLFSTANSCSSGQGNKDIDNDNRIHASHDAYDDLITGQLIRKLIPDDRIIEARLAVSPENYYNVASPMDGFVRQILVSEGQNVQKGTLLCILDHPDIYALQSSFLETKERINFYQHELQRKGDLSLDHAASMKSFQLAESDYRSALSLLNGYERKLGYLGIDADSIIKSGMVDDIRIYAPGSGVIISSGVETGTYLSTGDQIVEIARLDRMMAVSRISINFLAEFKNDSDLVFIPSMFDSLSLPAHFRGNSAMLNDDQTFQARFNVINRGNTLYPGMTGWISRGKPEFSYFVPMESTISINDDRFMFVYYENNLRRLAFIPGREVNGLIEVKDAEAMPEGVQIIYNDIELINSRFAENPACTIELKD
jgi:membrane fusion protein, heavy metal efflux system